MSLPPTPSISVALGSMSRELTVGLIAYYDFATPVVLGEDKSLNTINLVNINGVAAGLGPNGLPAAVFNGTNHLTLVAPATALCLSEPFAISLSARLFDKTSNQAFVGKYTGTFGNLREYYLGYSQSDDCYELVVSPDGSSAARLLAAGFGSPIAGAWHHLAAWWDGTFLNIAVDGGTPDTVAYSSGIAACGSAFHLGALDIGNLSNLNGSLAEVGIWGRTFVGNERIYLAVNHSWSEISEKVPISPRAEATLF